MYKRQAYELSDKIQAPTGLNQGLQKLAKGDDPLSLIHISTTKTPGICR